MTTPLSPRLTFRNAVQAVFARRNRSLENVGLPPIHSNWVLNCDSRSGSDTVTGFSLLEEESDAGNNMSPISDNDSPTHSTQSVRLKREDANMKISRAREINAHRSEKKHSVTGAPISSGRQSTNSLGSTGGLKAIPRQRRASFSLFPTKPPDNEAPEDRVTRLQEHLQHYTASLPNIPHSFSSKFPLTNPDFTCLKMEDNWEDVVKDSQTLSKSQVQQQAAMWELLQTEVNYLRQLAILVDVYAAVFLDLKGQFFHDVDENNVFGNIGFVLKANYEFWMDYLSLPFLQTRQSGDLMNPSLFKEGFLQIENLFAPYCKFCQSYNSIISFVQTQEKENPLFATYLHWANSRNGLNREGLSGVLCQPFQRIMKYGLILTMIKKYTLDQSQVEDLEEMIQSVHHYVDHINNIMDEQAQRQKLGDLISRIDSYDAVELPGEEFERHLEMSHLTVKLNRPIEQQPDMMRDVLFEGLLRMREAQTKSIDVFCVLLTDMFLICRPSKKNPDSLKIYKAPIRLDKIVVRRHSDSVFLTIILNDFGSAASCYVFTCADCKKIDDWVDKIKDAERSLHKLFASRHQPTQSNLKLSSGSNSRQPSCEAYPPTIALTRSGSAVSHNIPTPARMILPNTSNPRPLINLNDFPPFNTLPAYAMSSFASAACIQTTQSNPSSPTINRTHIENRTTSYLSSQRRKKSSLTLSPPTVKETDSNGGAISPRISPKLNRRSRDSNSSLNCPEIGGPMSLLTNHSCSYESPPIDRSPGFSMDSEDAVTYKVDSTTMVTRGSRQSRRFRTPTDIVVDNDENTGAKRFSLNFQPSDTSSGRVSSSESPQNDATSSNHPLNLPSERNEQRTVSRSPQNVNSETVNSFI